MGYRRRQGIILSFLLLVLGALLLFPHFWNSRVQAGGPEPGSQEDPLVSKSYVDHYVEKRVGEIKAEIEALKQKVKELEERISHLQGKKIIKLTVGSSTAYVNQQPRSLPAAPYLERGTAMVPFRFIGEELGAEVDYDNAAQKVSYLTPEHRVELKIGSRQGVFDGRIEDLPVPPTLVNGTTMVPLRAVSEGLGAEVKWDEGTRTVTIVK
ncbi:MAG TPA: hypothetical protein ENM97_00785 [Moorella mulderi]|nr:hypothetical protein [Moorella mulderi]